MTLPAKYSRRRGKLRIGLFVRRVLRCWPFLVWLAAIAGAIALYTSGDQIASMKGVVETVEADVVSEHTARIKAVHVKQGDSVESGQLILELDTSLIDAEIAVVEAGFDGTTATTAQHQLDLLQMKRQYTAAILDLESRVRNEERNLARDAAETEAIDRELNRLRELRKQQLIDEPDFSVLTARQHALQQAIASYPDVIAGYRQQIGELRTLFSEVEVWIETAAEDPTARVTEQIAASRALREQELELLRRKRASYQILATGAGTVTRVDAVVGAVAVAGSPLVHVVAPQASRVIGFLTEDFARELPIGTEAQIIGTANAQPVTGQVVMMGPDIFALPGRLSPIGGRNIRGRRVFFELQGESGLLPGESVRIQFRAPAWQEWMESEE